MPHTGIIKTNVGSSPITIGRFTYGAQYISVRQWNEGNSLTIGSFCSIADDINIFVGGDHRVDWASTFPFGHIYQQELGDTKTPGHPISKGDVTIGNDVWIGRGVTIMSGITIGDGAVIGANSMVTKDVAPYAIVGGNPARHLKFRFNQETIQLLLKLKWWDLPLENIKTIIPILCTQPIAAKLNELIKTYRGTND